LKKNFLGQTSILPQLAKAIIYTAS